MRLASLTGLASKAVDSLKRRGPLDTVKLLAKNVVHTVSPEMFLRAKRWYIAYEDRVFDKRFGTDTAGLLEPWQIAPLDDVSKRAVKYEATETHVMMRLLGELPIRIEHYVLVDVGSGKGRATMIASDFPFKKIIGVEYFEPLHEAALKNLSIYSNPAQRCKNIELVCADIRTFELPPGPLVVFAFNPFDGAIMRPFLERIDASLTREPRDLFFVYYNPLQLEVFKESKSLVEWRSKTQNEGDNYPSAIFRSAAG